MINLIAQYGTSGTGVDRADTGAESGAAGVGGAVGSSTVNSKTQTVEDDDKAASGATVASTGAGPDTKCVDRWASSIVTNAQNNAKDSTQITDGKAVSGTARVSSSTGTDTRGVNGRAR